MDSNRRHRKYLASLMLAIGILAVLSSSFGCSKSKSSSEQASIDDDDGGSGNNPPVGNVDDNDFWVRLYDNGVFPYHTHKSTGFSDSCKISASTSLSTIDCIIDANELDLYYNDIEFHYNVPTGMCDYFRITPYYFYNKEIGTGPSSITMNITFDENNAVVSHDCVVDGVAGPCSHDDSVPEYTEVNFDVSTASVTCVYDTSQTAFGANCCFGNYTLTQNITRQNPPDPDTFSSLVTYLDWSGTLGQCYGGSVRTSGWTLRTTSGAIASSIQYISNEGGLNKTLSFPALIDEANNGATMTYSNYYTSTGLHNHVDVATGTLSSSAPYAIEPIDDRNGSPISSTNEAYTFDCLDKAYEVKNRIRMYIREWDTYAGYLAFISSEGATVAPDVAGTEQGAACSGIDGPCNDFWDLDDIPNYLNGNSGSYDQTGMNKITRRYYFFPHLYY